MKKPFSYLIEHNLRRLLTSRSASTQEKLEALALSVRFMELKRGKTPDTKNDPVYGPVTGDPK